ncbi:MAG: quinate 5-dehydrogenase [Fimbriimonadaceae bacterium]|nr:quinate 5-dehydrogenase [Fimbriimonadaceae bacterium]
MKRVVSVSLGTSKRDKTSQTAILGETFQIERRGTDGDLKRFAALFTELDGQVDALGVGGCDIYVVVGERKYAFRQILSLVSGAKRTPVVDGSGLKHTLERQAILDLAERGIVDFKREKVLLVSAVDRYGMAQALVAQGADVVYGDLLFGLGLPIPIRSYRTVEWIGRLTLPIITRLPFKWFYPTGEKQEQRTPKHAKAFQEATFICGDWHFIRRYAPDRLDGKTVLTQTLRKADLDWLRSAGVRRAITTTPVIEGETFATNVMEGVLVTLIGKPLSEITEADYRAQLARLGWSPNVIELT